jgi:hypothetical protein
MPLKTINERFFLQKKNDPSHGMWYEKSLLTVKDIFYEML